MDANKLGFLEEVLGPEGAKALMKAAERAEKLQNVIVPRAILAWVNAAAKMSYSGAIPGMEGSLEFSKSECNGEIKIGSDTYQFNNAGVFSVAAAMAVSLKADDDQFDANLKDKDIVRLGKSIDLLVKSKMAMAELRKSPLVTPEYLGAGLAKLTGVDSAQFDHVSTKPLKNGMFHHVYALKDKTTYRPYWKDDGSFSYGKKHSDEAYRGIAIANNAPPEGYGLPSGVYFRHSISSSPNPFEDSSAEVEGVAAKDGSHMFVMGSKVRPELAGQGLGKLAYMAAASHHGRLISGSSVSENATKAYQALSANPALNVLIGTKGDIRSHHSIDLKNPEGLKAQLYAEPAQKAEEPGKGQPAAGRGPSAPVAPTGPGKQQGQKPKDTIATGTPVVHGQQAEINPFDQKSRVAMPDTTRATAKVRVSKSEAKRKCSVCQQPQFSGNTFTGCYCLSDLAKNTKTIAGPIGYTIEFKKNMDPDEILTIVESLKE